MPAGSDSSFRLALGHHQAGRLDEAEKLYRAILKEHPEHAGAMLYLGVAHHDRREFDEAIRLISRVIERHPSDAGARNHMGLALLARQELDEAAGQFEAALRLKPGFTDALNNLGNTLKRMKQFERAEAMFRQAIAADPRHVFAHHNLGLLLFDRRHFEEAEREFLAALDLAPNFHKTHHLLGQAAENLGRFEEAARRYETVLRSVPGHFPAMAALLALRDYEPDAQLIARAERMAEREDLPNPESYTLCFGLAKRFERRKEYERAFHFLQLANRRRRRLRPYARPRVEAVFQQYQQVFSREFLERFARYGNDSDRPVFVVGMPRTGTTLTEQILAAHPQIHGAGELPDLPTVTTRLAAQIAQAGALQPYPSCLTHLRPEHVPSATQFYLDVLDAQDTAAVRVVDKNPFNFINVGLIAMLFPRARIIHCQRHPLDVGLSCYTELFELKQDFTTDLGNFAHYYAHYRALMQHWREVLEQPMLEISYEALTEEPERVTRELVSFCGVEWDPACLVFQQTHRPVLTPSRWQVRQPIYRTSVARWRHYEAQLAPLRRSLEELGVPL